MADDLSGASAELIETLQRLNSSFRATGDALEQSTDTSNQNQRTLAAEFEKLGITLKGENTLLNTHAERVKERIRLEQEVNDHLRNSGKVRQDATQAEVEQYKLTQKRNVLYEQELASLGRVIDSNGKITKTQIELEGAQKRTIAAIKKEEESRREQEQGLAQFGAMMKALPQQAAMLALNQAFDTFAAGVTGAYKATIAYEDALLSGQRGMRVDAAATAARMQEAAKVTAKLGSSLSGMGDTAMAAGVGLMFLGGPVTMLAGAFTLLLGLVLKFEGLQKEQEAAMQERNAELVKKQAEINDKYSEGFRKLGEATLAGADGMTGLRDRLYAMTLAVTDLESYSKVLMENKKNLANLGGTMIEGVKSFSGVASELIRSSLGKTLETMGIGVEEMMGHTIQFMAYQNRLGLKTTGDVSKATGEYILELDRLAAITGTTRKEQEDARESILKEQKVQAALMIARQNNDEKEIKRIETIISAAGFMKAAGAVEEAKNFQFNQVMKGAITDAGTGRAAMIAGGRGGATEMLRNGEVDGLKVAIEYMAKANRQDKPMASSILYGGDNDLTSKNLYAQNNFVQTMEKLQKQYDEARKKDPNVGTFNEFLDSQKKVTDNWRKTQTDQERSQRLEQQAKESSILAGQMDTMAKAFQAPADGMMGAAFQMYEAAKKMLEASLNFLKSTWDTINAAGKKLESNLTEMFTGKDQKKQDAERLVALDLQIKTLKDIVKNPEEAKKIAEENLKLAKREYEQKNEQVKQLKKAYEDEKDLAKKQEALKKLQLAEQEAELAKNKKDNSKNALSATEKRNGMFGYPEWSRNNDKDTLAGLEANRAKLVGGSTGNSGQKFGSGSSTGSVGSVSTTSAQLKDAGLMLKQGDVQAEGAKIDPKLIEIAKQVQASAPGFMYFSGFNDNYHQENTPNSRHTKGLAFDMVVNPGRGKSKPSKEDDERIQKAIYAAGSQYGVNVKNEYEDTSGKFRTGGHYHVELPLPKAFDGGIFNGPKSGYPVELHGTEAIVPLANFGDKAAVENNQSGSASKTSLSNIMGDNSSGNDVSMMLVNMFSMMENKLDDMIDKLDTGNNYSDKLVKAMV